MSNKSDVAQNVISLPKGGGAVKGIGEKRSNRISSAGQAITPSPLQSPPAVMALDQHSLFNTAPEMAMVHSDWAGNFQSHELPVKQRGAFLNTTTPMFL
jgi:hypothetical protein